MGVVFENDVKMYGTQTTQICMSIHFWFENDVKMYGTQTKSSSGGCRGGLRMM